MVQIKLNGEAKTFEDEVTLADVMSHFHFATPFYAVAVNRFVIPRSEHENVKLKEGDELELVHAVGGG